MQIIKKDEFRGMSDIRADILNFIEISGLTQSEISKGSGVNQGQISKILSGRNVRVSGAVLKICQYANINAEIDRSSELPSELVDILRMVVGSDPSRARTVARVIRALVD